MAECNTQQVSGKGTLAVVCHICGQSPILGMSKTPGETKKSRKPHKVSAALRSACPYARLGVSRSRRRVLLRKGATTKESKKLPRPVPNAVQWKQQEYHTISTSAYERVLTVLFCATQQGEQSQNRLISCLVRPQAERTCVRR